ncbi:SNF7 family protein [Planoprotostelium fungivorum]|uniref:SNF7 family protein n=1 Tax=Planoprotostelium fungivorum TaxID=1890364 RepID=A0A2P6MQH4_9EUKA|nr:SNF7 family protein [Planoprotostelium fungivorum]
MAFLFGKKKTLKEILREHQRNINRAVRDIDRERTNLQNQEKKITMEMKDLAKKGQMGAVKIMAKDLVRTRNNVSRFYKMRTELQAVALRIQTVSSQNAMADAMKGVTKAMISMNKRMNIPQMQKIMMEFEKQSEMLDMKQEMMSDTMDDAFEQEGEEEETEEVINQVLDEIGIGLSSQLADAPQQSLSTGKADHQEDELQARLDNLRKVKRRREEGYSLDAVTTAHVKRRS